MLHMSGLDFFMYYGVVKSNAMICNKYFFGDFMTPISQGGFSYPILCSHPQTLFLPDFVKIGPPQSPFNCTTSICMFPWRVQVAIHCGKLAHGNSRKERGKFLDVFGLLHVAHMKNCVFFSFFTGFC